MFYVYILRSLKDGKLYTGFTSDLRRRVKEHFSGENLTLKSWAGVVSSRRCFLNRKSYKMFC